MYHAKAAKPCRVVKKITDRAVFRCLKPATVILVRHTPKFLAICSDCARELAKEICESVPGGLRDVSRRANEGRR
jgi:hypothetical protein